MKLKLLFLLALVLFVASCSYEGPHLNDTNIQEEHFRVDQASLNNVLHLQHLIGKTRSSAVRVDPILYEEDTVLFLVHYKKGWKLFSSDKRTNPVIAFSTKEDFNESLLSNNPALRDWIDNQSRFMHSLRTVSGGELNPFWKQTEQKETTRSHEPDEPGWRLIHVGDTTFIYDNIYHLIDTKWGQLEPWNKCTPLVGPDDTLRYATGCVNVALAQILYYLNDHYGTPEYAYSSASCNDYIHLYPYDYSSSFAFADSSSTVWSQIPIRTGFNGNPDYASYLMAKVATMSDTHYWYYSISGNRETYSFTNPSLISSLLETICNYFGLSSVYSSYSRTAVINSLQNGSPVFIHSYENENYEGGHAWIIDGYHNSTTLTKFFYIWDPENTYVIPNGEEEEEEEENEHGEFFLGSGYSFDFPSGYEARAVEYVNNQEYYLMNWGYDGAGDGIYFGVYDSAWSSGDGFYYLKSMAKIATGFAPLN